MKIALDIEFEARSGILVLVGLLVAYFALNTSIYTWSTFLFQTATVVAMGVILLILNERAQGNVIDVPPMPSLMSIIKVMVTIIVAIVLIVIGLSFISMAMYGLIPFFHPDFIAMMFVIMLAFGVAGVIYGLKMFADFLETEDEAEIEEE